MLSDSCLYVAWVRWPPGRTAWKANSITTPLGTTEISQMSCPTSHLLLCQLGRWRLQRVQGRPRVPRTLLKGSHLELQDVPNEHLGKGVSGGLLGPAHFLARWVCGGLGDRESGVGSGWPVPISAVVFHC